MASLEEQFKLFAKFGAIRSDGTSINLTQCDKWMKDAKVIDGKNITTNDTSMCFAKLRSRSLKYKEFLQYIEIIAKDKKMDPEEIKSKLASCGAPNTAGSTKAADTGVYGRLTDTTKYTGMHKERFDDSGKGKGIKGRENVTANDGYVQGYKNKGAADQRGSKS